MKFQGAVIREQGVTFAVAVVKRHVVSCRSTASRTSQAFSGAFPGLPLVLMAQDARGTPTYLGRPDLARFLSKVPLRAIPWREYTIN
ncbi:hypothetical protein CSC82_02650 [Rhodobacteraceae bacterium 4F10]|nr:hypothetical protein CSC82_02650 [Rhodobacteraceae bacterium 4F10]